MARGIKLPLHFFLDVHLEAANFNIADLHIKKLAPEPTSSNPSPCKLLIFDISDVLTLVVMLPSPETFLQETQVFNPRATADEKQDQNNKDCKSPTNRHRIASPAPDRPAALRNIPNDASSKQQLPPTSTSHHVTRLHTLLGDGKYGRVWRTFSTSGMVIPWKTKN